MRSNLMSNPVGDILYTAEHQRQSRKPTASRINCFPMNSRELRSFTRNGNEFIIKTRKSSKNTKNKDKPSENVYLSELPPFFFKGLHVFVKNVNIEDKIKHALERVGSIVVDNPNYSDLIITDEFIPTSPGIRPNKEPRQVLVEQISWIHDFGQEQNTPYQSSNINFSPNMSNGLINRSTLSSPMLNNSPTELTSSQIVQTTANAKKQSKLASPIRHVISPCNQIAAASSSNCSINNLMNIKNNGISNTKAITKSFNDSYRKIHCQPLSPSSQTSVPTIVVSDIRHLYAPISKAFQNEDQIPQIYLETGPQFYFVTPFQPVPPNAKQIAHSYMQDKNRSYSKSCQIPANPNDISAVIGKNNYYCYICRINFDNAYEHHNSYYHIRNTKPLWEEFDQIAASFNEFGS